MPYSIIALVSVKMRPKKEAVEKIDFITEPWNKYKFYSPLSPIPVNCSRWRITVSLKQCEYRYEAADTKSRLLIYHEVVLETEPERPP
jgi:hypothetical protein